MPKAHEPGAKRSPRAEIKAPQREIDAAREQARQLGTDLSGLTRRHWAAGAPGTAVVDRAQATVDAAFVAWKAAPDCEHFRRWAAALEGLHAAHAAAGTVCPQCPKR